MGKITVAAKDIGGKCVVRAHEDCANDVREYLLSQGLCVKQYPGGIFTNTKQMEVWADDDTPATAKSVQVFLKGNTDFEVVPWD